MNCLFKPLTVAGLYHGDSRDVLRTLPDNSIDACVTDPPYALVSIVKRFGGKNAAPAKSNGASGVYARASAGFMGKSWDTGEVAFAAEFWSEVYRVLKPGGHVVSFGGTRTYHRMAVAIEDAGFEIRDQIQWLYGTGFPKSHDVSKAIDKMDKSTAKLDFVRWMQTTGIKAGEIDGPLKEKGLISPTSSFAVHFFNEGQPALPTQEYWEVIHTLCESKGITPPDDIEKFINLRVYGSETFRGREVVGQTSGTKLAVAPGQVNDRSATELDITRPATPEAEQWEGWGTALKPANEPICLARKPLEGTVAENVLKWGTGAINIDGCRIATDENLNGGRYSDNKNEDDGNTYGSGINKRSVNDYSQPLGRFPANVITDGSVEMPNGAQRFFYSAKASKADRGEGNVHPTVKPTDLMRYLCRLVTPPGGVVLDPFMGSGSTGKAAHLEGFKFVGIEREEEYFRIAQERIANAQP